MNRKELSRDMPVDEAFKRSHSMIFRTWDAMYPNVEDDPENFQEYRKMIEKMRWA